MAQPYYRVTYPGVLFSVCDNELTQFRAFMLYLVKHNSCHPFSLTDMKAYFGDDNRLALKTIYHAINMGWIDIDEASEPCTELVDNTDLVSFVTTLPDIKLVLSDYSGFPVIYCGFNKYDAECISALSCASMRNAVQSRRLSGQSSPQPLSFTLDWHESVMLGQVWNVGPIQLCVSLVNNESLKNDDVFQLISLLTRRYYEQ